MFSIADVEFDEHFGFTDGEVKELLEYYQFPDAYWSNTSGNDIIRHFIGMADATTKMEIENLKAGEAIEKVIRKELTYKDLYDSIDNLWSVLYLIGYLTSRGRAEGDRIKLAIPNQEIRKIFEDQIVKWFHDTVREDGATLNAFCEAFRNGDAAKVQEQFRAYLKKTISIRDTFVRKEMKENFYHGILVGLLGYKTSWVISSNHESGDGYSDILVEINDDDIGIVIEVKYADNGDLEDCCRKALEQIEKYDYDEQLRDSGMETILKYGIACYKKRCMVMLAEEHE